MKSTTATAKSANLSHGLRCKPGQLAIVTQPPGVVFPSRHRNLLGLVVRVEKLVFGRENGIPMWTYEGRLIRTADGTALIDAISDFVLSPIPDDLLGDDEASQDVVQSIPA